MSSKQMEDSSLFWLCVYIRPHLFGRAMFDSYLLLINLVLDEVILHLNVLGSLRATCLKQDSTRVVLIEQRWIHIVSLLLHEVTSPQDIPQCFIHSN